jgi:hypothetical protein
MFDGDSLPLQDTTGIILVPEFSGNIVLYPELKVFIPGEGWRIVFSNFSIPAFYRDETILRKWYNGEGWFATDISLSSAEPEQFDVKVFPNPFNGTINITAPENSEISVYDIRGRLIEKLNSFSWSPGKTTGSGIYIITVKSKEKLCAKRAVYLK